MCQACPDSYPHVQHGTENDCSECAGVTLLPRGLSGEKDWRCACRVRRAEGEKPDPNLTFPDEDSVLLAGSVQADLMLAVKLDGEWSNKVDQEGD